MQTDHQECSALAFSQILTDMQQLAAVHAPDAMDATNYYLHPSSCSAAQLASPEMNNIV